MAGAPAGPRYYGWRRNDTTLEVQVQETNVADFTTSGLTVNGTFSSTGALTVDAGGLTVTAGGLTVTAGGLTVTAGVLSVDDTTDSTSAVTGSIHTDGGLGVAKNAFFALTIENPDGVGSDGEQLTSGGAAAATDWAAAGSLREFKHVGDERFDAQAVLERMVNTKVYDFQYKHKNESDKHVISTGDTKTVYTGVMADEAPWAMHHNGRIFDPVSAFGNTLLALRALDDRLRAVENK